MKIFKKLLIMMVLVQATAFAGHETGNGGDLVRLRFLEEGSAVLREIYMGFHPSISENSNISLERLSGVLSADFIKISNDELFDNTGSRVDALGEANRIVLYKPFWEKNLAVRSREVSKLIFHELLRASSHDDDDYKISSLLSFSRIGKVSCSIFVKDINDDSSSSLRKPKILLEIDNRSVNKLKTFIYKGIYIKLMTSKDLLYPQVNVSHVSGYSTMILSAFKELERGQYTEQVMQFYDDSQKLKIDILCGLRN
jgi:hypothetical protein